MSKGKGGGGRASVGGAINREEKGLRLSPEAAATSNEIGLTQMALNRYKVDSNIKMAIVMELGPNFPGSDEEIEKLILRYAQDRGKPMAGESAQESKRREEYARNLFGNMPGLEPGQPVARSVSTDAYNLLRRDVTFTKLFKLGYSKSSNLGNGGATVRTNIKKMPQIQIAKASGNQVLVHFGPPSELDRGAGNLRAYPNDMNLGKNIAAFLGYKY